MLLAEPASAMSLYDEVPEAATGGGTAVDLAGWVPPSKAPKPSAAEAEAETAAAAQLRQSVLFKPRQRSVAAEPAPQKAVVRSKPVPMSAGTGSAEEGEAEAAPESHPSYEQLTFDIEDEYDPHVPTDYMQCCRDRLAEKRQRRLDESNAATQSLREAARKQELAAAAATGVWAATGGTGRGRAMQVPAWMSAMQSGQPPPSG